MVAVAPGTEAIVVVPRFERPRRLALRLDAPMAEVVDRIHEAPNLV